MRNLLNIIIIILLFVSSQANAKISEKDYLSIFSKYKLKNQNTIQTIINQCVDKLGKNNIKIIRNNDGKKIIDHKKEKEFLDCTYAKILKVIRPIPGVNSYPKKKSTRFYIK